MPFHGLRSLAFLASALAPVAAGGAQTQRPGTPPPDTVASSAGNIRITRLATLEYPWGLAVLPGGRLLITEKPGRLRIWENGRLSEPVRGVPSVVYVRQGEQGGMLDVEADPNYATNHLVYLSYSEADPNGAKVSDVNEFRFGGPPRAQRDSIVRGAAVARGRLEGNELRDVQVIWRQVPKTVARGHFGVRIVFGPDGKLYLTSGERMRFDPAADLRSNLGKVVRINPDGSMPADNPFAGSDTARADIWTYGHRNMLSMAFDPAGRLWVLEMGPEGGDELNLIERGKNYGWPYVSDGDNYGGPSIPDHATEEKKYTRSVRSFTPVIAPSGALFYSGASFPAWRGSMLAGGLATESIVRLRMDGVERVAEEERVYMARRIRDLAQAADGSLFVITDAKDGELLRLTPLGK